MRILAFDTTLSACSVALWCDGNVEAESCKSMTYGQAEALVPAIEIVLSGADCAYHDIDRVAVTIGPGSFTGVRVGLAAARGLGVAMERPVIGVETTAVMAEEVQQKKPHEPIIVALDARRAELYIHRFGPGGIALEDPLCMLPEAAAELLHDGYGTIIGDGANRLFPLVKKSYLCSGPAHPDPRVLAALAAARSDPINPPSPLYVRPPDATLPKSGGRLRP
ncbi:MAG: tRNA (adenosine(37)-N6)-threonylcarbamoyltransferase complex dimerization subunit type 1 TsaB [Rhodospirillaceae bacterium]